jgi:hypothetical protein
MHTKLYVPREGFQLLVLSFLSQASMLTSPDGPFINLSRLNLTKYSQKPKLAKVCASKESKL